MGPDGARGSCAGALRPVAAQHAVLAPVGVQQQPRGAREVFESGERGRMRQRVQQRAGVRGKVLATEPGRVLVGGRRLRPRRAGHCATFFTYFAITGICTYWEPYERGHILIPLKEQLTLRELFCWTCRSWWDRLLTKSENELPI